MSFKLGLTGSIGMGKSTTAKMFADAGCAVWDANAAVHRLYARGGGAVEPIRAILPAAIIDEAVSRTELRKLISQDSSVLKQLEQIVHPLVALDRAGFEDAATTEILVFDIPLLFEGNGHREMDAIACVTVSPELQKERVLARGTMSAAQFEQLRAKQMPNHEKCAKSDFVIETDTLDHTRAQVLNILNTIREQLDNA